MCCRATCFFQGASHGGTYHLFPTASGIESELCLLQDPAAYHHGLCSDKVMVVTKIQNWVIIDKHASRGACKTRCTHQPFATRERVCQTMRPMNMSHLRRFRPVDSGAARRGLSDITSCDDQEATHGGEVVSKELPQALGITNWCPWMTCHLRPENFCFEDWLGATRTGRKRCQVLFAHE